MEPTMVACFTCNGYPGSRNWKGYFRKQGEQWLHVDCPDRGKKEAEAALALEKR